MPHIVIKTISGSSKAELQKAAEQIGEIINKTLGKLLNDGKGNA